MNLTDEQKAKLEEIKARFEAMRAGHGGHDSLGGAGKEGFRPGFRPGFGAGRNAEGPLSEERKALHEDIKALVEEYRAQMAADGADKEAIAAELKEKIKALTDAFRAEHKAALDSLKADRRAGIEAHRGEWEKRLADGKARFQDARHREIGEGPGARVPLTPEQIAELKKRLEDDGEAE